MNYLVVNIARIACPDIPRRNPDAQVPSRKMSLIDYYPFGMLMPDRNYNSTTYDFGFNGQMKTDEISGAGNHNTSLFWEYDTRLARRWNLDPIEIESESPYSCLSNNPNFYVDPNGDFRTKFGAFLYTLVHGGSIVKDEGGEYGVNRNTIENGDIIVRPTVFDNHGRTEAIDLEFEKRKKEYINYLNDQQTIDEWEKLGLYDRNLSSEEARKNFINNSLILTLPSPILKRTVAITNTSGVKEIIAAATKGKGNFGLGTATYKRAMETGKAWVGKGYTIASDGKTLLSKDKLRQFRPPSLKPNLGKMQANFESRTIPSGRYTSNGHLDIFP